MNYAGLDNLETLISGAGVYSSLFDIIRIVDAQAGKLIELVDGVAKETQIECTNVLGTTERCKNCSSIRCLYSNEQVVKLEYVGGSILLVVSAPMRVGEKFLVAELIKDVTTSMTIENHDANRQGEVAIIIDNLNKLATTDTLTGLMNRRYIDEKLPLIIQNCKKLERPVSLAFIDVDLFKNINDIYGHTVGDKVLATLGDVLRSFIRRDSDFAARYGGEEFMFCFPGTPLEACLKICERIRKKVEEYEFLCDGERIHVTVSIGVAESGEFEEATKDDIIALADKRLYEAKASGRNNVQ